MTPYKNSVMRIFLVLWVLELLVPSGHPHIIQKNVTLPGDSQWIETSLTFASSSTTYTLPNVVTLSFTQPAAFNFLVTRIVFKAFSNDAPWVNLNVGSEDLPVSEFQSSCVSETRCTVYEGPLPFLAISNGTVRLFVYIIWERDGVEVGAVFDLEAQSFFHPQVDHSVDQSPFEVGSYARLPPLVVEQISIEQLPVSLPQSSMVTVKARNCSKVNAVGEFLEPGVVLDDLNVYLNEECWGGTTNTNEGVFSVEIGGSPVFYFGHQVVLQPKGVAVAIVNDSLADMRGHRLNFRNGGFQALVSWGTAEPFPNEWYLTVFLLGEDGFQYSFCNVFSESVSQEPLYRCWDRTAPQSYSAPGVFKLAVMYKNFESDYVMLAESSAFYATWSSLDFVITEEYQLGSRDMLEASWTVDGELSTTSAKIEIEFPGCDREILANTTHEDGFYVFEGAVIEAIEYYIERCELYNGRDVDMLDFTISSGRWRSRRTVWVTKQIGFVARYGWYITGAALLIITIFSICKCRKSDGERLLQ